MCMSLERYQKMCVCQVNENFHLLLVALISKNNDVPTDFHAFLDKVVCSTEGKTSMSLECTKGNESIDTFTIFQSDIKFYQWKQNEDNHTEKTLNYGDYGEVFDMLQDFLVHTYVKRLQLEHFESLHDNVNGQENVGSNQNSAHLTNNQCTLFTVYL